jgi:hypothetical protein
MRFEQSRLIEAFGLTDTIRNALHDPCQKLIKYDGTNIYFSAMTAHVFGISFSIGQFSRSTELLRKTADLALALDDHQLLLCNLCREIGKKNSGIDDIIRFRIATIRLITQFRLCLAAAQEQEPNMANQLEAIPKEMSELNQMLYEENKKSF